MIRKVSKTGPASLTISLPSKWTKANNITKGSEVDVTEQKNSLIINSSLKKERISTDIELTAQELDDDRYLETLMESLFIKGYDKIMITLPDKKYTDKIQTFVKNCFLGYELTSIEANKCVIENVVEPSDEKFDVLIRRIFLITKETINNIYDDLISGKIELLDTLNQQKAILDTYVNYCLKIIVNKRESYYLWSLLLRIKQIYHIMCYAYRYIPKYAKTIKLSEDTKQLFQGFVSLYDETYNLYYSKDLNKAKEIHQKYYKMMHPAYYDALLSKRQGELFLIYHIGKATRQVLYCCDFIIAMNV